MLALLHHSLLFCGESEIFINMQKLQIKKIKITLITNELLNENNNVRKRINYIS